LATHALLALSKLSVGANGVCVCHHAELARGETGSNAKNKRARVDADRPCLNANPLVTVVGSQSIAKI
jgi:hypothetical protein